MRSDLDATRAREREDRGLESFEGDDAALTGREGDHP
jgi:hypothetical protein